MHFFAELIHKKEQEQFRRDEARRARREVGLVQRDTLERAASTDEGSPGWPTNATSTTASQRRSIAAAKTGSLCRQQQQHPTQPCSDGRPRRAAPCRPPSRPTDRAAARRTHIVRSSQCDPGTPSHSSNSSQPHAT
ncbi:unnamed protein product [Gongylonema pulchrum]|uniref:Uncharacterized protein n=1 Tax=Gongylonema pulchrum TaxID=637853 RepID=A0A183E7Y2_9BILA|nr:unnamed protein product [Gongylonema pulchrum]